MLRIQWQMNFLVEKAVTGQVIPSKIYGVPEVCGISTLVSVIPQGQGVFREYKFVDHSQGPCLCGSLYFLKTGEYWVFVVVVVVVACFCFFTKFGILLNGAKVQLKVDFSGLHPAIQ